jgi:hypothetical protein
MGRSCSSGLLAHVITATTHDEKTHTQLLVRAPHVVTLALVAATREPPSREDISDVCDAIGSSLKLNLHAAFKLAAEGEKTTNAPAEVAPAAWYELDSVQTFYAQHCLYSGARTAPQTITSTYIHTYASMACMPHCITSLITSLCYGCVRVRVDGTDVVYCRDAVSGEWWKRDDDSINKPIGTSFDAVRRKMVDGHELPTALFFKATTADTADVESMHGSVLSMAASKDNAMAASKDNAMAA